MSYLSMVEAKLAPGFRFHPRDDELICDYLAPKIISKDRDCGNDNSFPFMIDIDLNKCEPWDLPEMACVGSKEWYFFNLRDRKYSTGQRTNRATISGYWKATGKDRQVVRKGTLVGMRKTLVFYQGRAPKGKKTDWVMHEFRSEGRSGPPSRLISCKEDWVLCRVFYKSREIRMASKQVTVESYWDDISSSSLPLLSDACVRMGQCNFQLPPLLPSTSAINIPSNNFNANASTTSLEQVPCFSSYIQIPRQTKDLASSCFKYVYDQLSKWDEKHQQEASSESFLTETTHSSSIRYPFQS